MKFRALTRITAITLFTALAIPARLAAQEQQQQQEPQKEHHRYIVKDVGTFGGPNSFVNDGNPPRSQVENNRGTVAGTADTAIPDPYSPNCLLFCFVSHAFQWQNGVLTDLGALPGVTSSFAIGINGRGLIVGASENGAIDPVTGFPEVNAVLWKDGQIINLGTLGGTQSYAIAVNNRGQVVGGALNTVPDPFEANFDLIAFLFFPGATQQHAFLWEEGVMHDLGTLGGPDSEALFVNERGQIAGVSFTNSTPNPVTGIPTLDPFLYEHGTMLDLGTLGGTVGTANDLNAHGQVAGTMNLAGDLTHHPFLWDRGALTDLGTLGGKNGEAWWLNDAGEVVGRADFSAVSNNHRAFLWRRGVMTDLGTVDGDPCSTAHTINSKGQIVGNSGICGGPPLATHPFLWENGGPMLDLNTLVPRSDLYLYDVEFINDRGEIAVEALLPNGDHRAVLLIPCDNDHADTEGCEDATAGATAVTQGNPASAMESRATETPANPTIRDRPSEMPAALRARLPGRYHVPVPGTGPTN